MPYLRLIFAAAALALLSTACVHAGNTSITLPPPGPASDTLHEQGVWRGAGGIALFEQSWLPAGEVRAALVVVHGLKDHSDHYADAAQAWAGHGIAVYAFDLRGHGRSTGDAVWVNDFDEYVSDLDLFVARVKQRQPGRKLFVLGHSMGGAIVTRWAMDKQPDVDGVVLSAPALKAGADVSPVLIGITGALGALVPGLGVLDLPNQAFSRDPAVVDAMAKDPLIHQDPGPARTAAELLDTIGYIQEHMERMTLPFLVLHGTVDTLTNPEGSRELAARASSTDKTLKLYDGLAHDLLHEPERARVLDDITAWLDAR